MSSGSWSAPIKLPSAINSFLPAGSAGSVYHAHLSPEGSELYFTIDDFTFADDIYVARLDENMHSWDSVTRLSVNKNDIRRELSPSVTADHSRLYWCSWNSTDGYGSYDVWFAEWNSSKKDWGDPQNAGPDVNTPGAEYTCYITPDGKTLYVQSDYDSDCDDIYKHSLRPDGTWGPRERVFEEFHTGTCEYDPWVSADGMWLYFSMWTGGRTIWRSRWEGTYFGNPEMLPEPVFVNGDWQFNDGSSLNALATRMFFSSNRPDSNGQWEYMWYSDYVEDTTRGEDESCIYNLRASGGSGGDIEISYSIPQYSQVFCGIFDPGGNLIKILASETQPAGDHSFIWNGSDDRGRFVDEGSFFVRLTIDHCKVIKKAVNFK